MIFNHITIAKTGDYDQVIIHLCQHLSLLLPYVGGPSEAGALIPIIEPLCHLEETVLREAITSSVCSILAVVPPDHEDTMKAFFDMTQRLYDGDEESDSFFGRVSICFYLHALYDATADSDNKESIRDMYSKLIADDFPMVRSSAAKILPKLARTAPKDILIGEFMHYLSTLCSDESEAVKVAAVESLQPLGELLAAAGTSHEERAELISSVKSAAYDPSWRVRIAISRSLKFFVSFFAPERSASDLLPCGITLIQDVEIEVRSIAIEAMAPFYAVSGNSFLTEFVAVAKLLLEDPQCAMKKGLADVCIDVAAQAGPEIAANYFNDLIIKLIGDADPMVRLRVLKKLDVIAQDIPSLCVRLVSTLRQFFSDAHWRTRLELAKSMPAVVKHFGMEFFLDHFLAEFLITLKDDVCDVRFATCDALRPLMEAAGK